MLNDLRRSVGALLVLSCVWLVDVGTASAGEVTLRVVDVGPGLCVVVHAPPNNVFVYDAGFSGSLCSDAVQAVSGSQRDCRSGRVRPNQGAEGAIDLIVLSHSDDDHINDLLDILCENSVGQIIHPGDARGEVGLRARRAAIGRERATTYNLAREGIDYGTAFELGDATVRFIAGWSDAADIPLYDDDPVLRDAPYRNALSIVMRVEYGGHSVLLTGDTIGRAEPRRGEPDVEDALRYAERFMVDNSEDVDIDSDVLVGQHHGSDNSSSRRFVEAVSPEFVIFSAGHKFQHPRRTTVDRLYAAGVDPNHVFRTDRGDDESRAEWDGERVRGCKDGPGDDDVMITLPSTGDVRVEYDADQVGCA